MFDGFWYRCEVKHYSAADEWGDHSYTSTQVEWTKYAVVAETPKGVWLTRAPWSTLDPDKYRGQKGQRLSADVFVLGTSKRQEACPTKDLAIADAIARKKRHIAGCEARLRAAEHDLQALVGLCPACLLTDRTTIGIVA